MKNHIEENCLPAISIDTCSRDALCLVCPRWSAIKKTSISSNLLTEVFFENRELRFDRISRSLCLFISNVGHIVAKDTIIDAVWRNRAASSNIPVLIFDLRILLGDQRVELVNIRGEGYVLRSKNIKTIPIISRK